VTKWRLKVEEVQRLRVKRQNCRDSITKLLTKVEDVMSRSKLNTTTVTDSRRLAFNTTLGHLKTKRDLIIKLDSDISDTVKEEEELEAELNDSDSYLMDLEKIAIVEEYVRKASQPPVTLKQDTHSLASHPPSNTDMMSNTMLETDVVKKPTNDHVSADFPIDTVPLRSTAQTHSRPPKLTLPTFSGNPLKWQTFCNSFNAADDMSITSPKV